MVGDEATSDVNDEDDDIWWNDDKCRWWWIKIKKITEMIKRNNDVDDANEDDKCTIKNNWNYIW